MTKKPCTHEYLSTSGTSTVLMCRECEVVYLHMQNLSLHFSINQFSKFAAMMTEAAKKLDAETIEKRPKHSTLTLVR